MKRLVPIGLAVFLLVLSSWASAQEERRRIELTAPGEYTESDCLYVMTRDVVATGNAFSFTGKNVVVDLGGHTLTFNAEPYVPKFDAKASASHKYYFTPPYGVLLARGAAGIELRNGTIVQGAGADKKASCVFIQANGANIHDTTTVTAEAAQARNFFSVWGPSDLDLHHNYIVNRGSAEGGWYGAVSLTMTGTGNDIHHNTIVGGHQGILISAQGGPTKAHVHHNFIQHQRTRGQKAPQGIYIRASGCEIDHNQIVTVDGRGLEPTGGDNHWHHNVVDVRYTSRAGGGFYPENRCYGLWARDAGCDGNRITDNLFVVNNEVVGDDTSNTIGLLLCTSPGNPPQLNNVTVTGNRIFVRHNDRTRPAWGFSLANTGPNVVIRDNFIWADTAAVEVDDRARGAVIEGNTFVKTGEKWQEKVAAWQNKGDGLATCTFRDNKVIDPPVDKTPPAAPGGLAVTRRFNGFELHWNASAEPDVLGYYVYRDGVRVEDRLKCGTFYV
ncbi:MAG TPA: hypothetical protein VMY39_11000, partial [Planctomycetota bacterium]|nr:hypothetical protein [Planctomycetota bacterium]